MNEKKPSKKTPQRPGGSSSPMDPGLLEQIVKLMAANDLNTVDVRDGERRVILKRGPAVAPVAYAAAPIQAGPAAPGPGPATSPMVPAAQTGAPPAPPAEDAGLVPIKSEMVGTFYSKPSPDAAKPFVSVGSTVDEETVVCVIEAMKHFNPVKAETRGMIARVLVTDGQTVDVGKPLFLVKPS